MDLFLKFKPTLLFTDMPRVTMPRLLFFHVLLLCLVFFDILHLWSWLWLHFNCFCHTDPQMLQFWRLHYIRRIFNCPPAFPFSLLQFLLLFLPSSSPLPFLLPSFCPLSSFQSGITSDIPALLTCPVVRKNKAVCTKMPSDWNAGQLFYS